jgi:hypothetical protein
MSGLAPQSGYVSNFCQPVGPVIEPVDTHCFQRDPSGPLTRVHGGHPIWTLLELTSEAPDNSRYKAVIHSQSAQRRALVR